MIEKVMVFIFYHSHLVSWFTWWLVMVVIGGLQLYPQGDNKVGNLSIPFLNKVNSVVHIIWISSVRPTVS